MSSEARGTTVAELAALAGGRVVAGGEVRVERVAPLGAGGEGALCFVEAEKFLGQASGSRAACLIVPEGAGARAREVAPQVPAVVEAARPKLAFALAAEVLHAPGLLPAGAHATAVVAEDAELGAGAYVGPHAFVGRGCVLRANVVL